MWLLEPQKKGDKSKGLKQLALLTAIPAILVVAPLAGLVIGKWIDGKAHTEPILTILMIVLGFVAAAREIATILKKINGPKKENGNENKS